jgi:hypothetical protein
MGLHFRRVVPLHLFKIAGELRHAAVPAVVPGGAVPVVLAFLKT